MPLIWAAISGHGFGHAAQVVPVLNELGKLLPKLTAVLRTTVPASFFRDRLTIPWTLQSVSQDVGCLQRGPLDIDVRTTWEAIRSFHAGWETRVSQEVAALNDAQPQVILADTPYLACAAGAEADIPTVGLANFTWNEVLALFMDPRQPDHPLLLSQIAAAYGRGSQALRIAPGLPLASYRTVTDIGPIAEPATSQRAAVRQTLRLAEAEQLVLVGFGGIPLESLPWDRMEQMKGYYFLVDGGLPRSFSNIHSITSVPFSFKTLLASVDLVMTKPGYGTTVEAVALGTPVVYVRRYNFADEPPLVAFLNRHGRAAELTKDDFAAGRWELAFTKARDMHPLSPPPPCSGAREAAHLLQSFF